MHLPLLPQQAAAHPGLPCLPLDTLVHGVGLALQTAWEVQDDMHVAGGATH